MSTTVTRLPVPEPEHRQVPVGSVDVLPMLAAAAWPDRTALLGDAGPITFAELDHRISRLAAGIRTLIGGDGSVVAVSAQPGVEFAVAYYAVVRSGNVVAPVHPQLDAAVLDRLLVSVAARAVVLTGAMHDRARPVLTAAPGLEHVLLLDGADIRPGVPVCAELCDRGLLVEPRDRDENEVGAIVFGAGRCGYAKAAGRRHHELKLDAVRTGAAHGLSDRAVTLNALPSFQQGHLNAAVWTGATQVFCGSQDPGVLAGEIERHGASHCYRLPGEHPPFPVPDRTVVAS